MQPDVSVIIVSWNGRQHLETSLTSVRAQAGVDIETIVVDNGSTDGTPEFVRARFPWVRLVTLDVNQGFAAGNNVGAAAARGRFVAFLNNDTCAEAGWLRALLAGLDERQSESLVQRRIHQRDGAAIQRADTVFAHRSEDHDGLRTSRLGRHRAQSGGDAAIHAREYERQRGGRAEVASRLQQRIDHDGKITALVDIADVQEKRLGDIRRQIERHIRIARRKRSMDAKRRDGNA
jgi:glycosyltransferase involved in cell wall biosynthesis